MLRQNSIQNFSDITQKQRAHAGAVVVRVAVAYGEQAEGVAVDEGNGGYWADFFGIFSEDKLHFFCAKSTAHGTVTFENIANIVACLRKGNYVRLAAGNFINIAEEK